MYISNRNLYNITCEICQVCFGILVRKRDFKKWNFKNIFLKMIRIILFQKLIFPLRKFRMLTELLSFTKQLIEKILLNLLSRINWYFKNESKKAQFHNLVCDRIGRLCLSQTFCLILMKKFNDLTLPSLQWSRNYR